MLHFTLNQSYLVTVLSGLIKRYFIVQVMYIKCLAGFGIGG